MKKNYRRFLKRQQYQKQVNFLRKELWSKKCTSFEDYATKLSNMVSEKGTFINCNETLDLLSLMLQKKGIDFKRIYMYTTVSLGEKTAKAEHVFCVLGMDKKAKVSDTSTWGASAVIFDPWAKMAVSLKEGLKRYEELFFLDFSKHNVVFKECQRCYPH